jgi:hypothetical protein
LEYWVKRTVMNNFMRMLSIPVLVAMLWLGTGCTGAALSVGVGNGYGHHYGDRRLPYDYFYYDDYYDGMWDRDYVYYDDGWYYQGYDTPYYYDYDPYVW